MTRLTPEREKEISKDLCANNHVYVIMLELRLKNDQLRGQLDVAISALSQVSEYCRAAINEESPYAHSFNLGLAAGISDRALEKIRGEK